MHSIRLLGRWYTTLGDNFTYPQLSPCHLSRPSLCQGCFKMVWNNFIHHIIKVTRVWIVLFLGSIFLIFFYFLYVCAYMGVHVWRSENNLLGVVLSSHYVGPRDHSEAVKLCRKCREYPRSLVLSIPRSLTAKPSISSTDKIKRIFAIVWMSPLSRCIWATKLQQ